MKIEFDPDKRLKILHERGIDIADAGAVFNGDYVEILDDRKDYGEVRYRVWGFLGVMRISLVWTPRGDRRRIITMRRAHEYEHEARRKAVD
ncbi:MAG: BrnT family toxin [Sphingopyxis sp.]|nr:BrnT family toxin [Sphingopyxis sp.]